MVSSVVSHLQNYAADNCKGKKKKSYKISYVAAAWIAIIYTQIIIMSKRLFRTNRKQVRTRKKDIILFKTTIVKLDRILGYEV